MVFVVAMLTTSAGEAVASTGVRAVLDGQPITLKTAEQLSCHDFDYPVLTCFRTAGEMETAAATVANARQLEAASSGYIVIFENGDYAGAARTVSQDYAYLGDIGFNDRISSLKSYGATGHFWENAPSGGLLYYFGATSRVPYVGDTYNDKFSAVYLD